MFKIRLVLIEIWEVTSSCQVWEDVWLYHTVNYRDQSSRCRGLRVSSELHTQDIQDHLDSPIQSLIASNVTTAAITIEFYQTGGYWPLSFPTCLIGTFNQISKTKKFLKNPNFVIQLLSPVCSLLLYYYTFIILPCASASDRKVKIVFYRKNPHSTCWLCR